MKKGAKPIGQKGENPKPSIHKIAGRYLQLKFSGEPPSLARVEFCFKKTMLPRYFQRGDSDYPLRWPRLGPALSLCILGYVIWHAKKTREPFLFGSESRDRDHAKSLAPALYQKNLQDLFQGDESSSLDNPTLIHQVFPAIPGVNKSGKSGNGVSIPVGQQFLPLDCVQIYWDRRGSTPLCKLADYCDLEDQLRRSLGKLVWQSAPVSHNHNHALSKPITPASRKQASELLTKHKDHYTAGYLSKAYDAIKQAHELSPGDSEINSRWMMMQLRCGSDGIFRVKSQYNAAAPSSAEELLVFAEAFRRGEEYDKAIDTLRNRVADQSGYRVWYELGVTYSSKAMNRMKNTGDKLESLKYLQKAYKIAPQHWWVTTNLAIAQKIFQGHFDRKLKQAAKAQLDAALSENKAKASARIYRLLWYVIHDDWRGFERAVAHDLRTIPRTMEVAMDFVGEFGGRLSALTKQPVRYERKFLTWAQSFTPFPR